MNSCKGFASLWLHKKMYLSLKTHVLAVVETPFLRPKNVRYFNSKLGWVADANQTINISS